MQYLVALFMLAAAFFWWRKKPKLALLCVFPALFFLAAGVIQYLVEGQP